MSSCSRPLGSAIGHTSSSESTQTATSVQFIHFVLGVMLGAIKTHVDLAEPVVAPAALAVLAFVVAVGRSGVLGQ